MKLREQYHRKSKKIQQDYFKGKIKDWEKAHQELLDSLGAKRVKKYMHSRAGIRHYKATYVFPDGS